MLYHKNMVTLPQLVMIILLILEPRNGPGSDGFDLSEFASNIL